jgi:hypothetical protein
VAVALVTANVCQRRGPSGGLPPDSKWLEVLYKDKLSTLVGIRLAYGVKVSVMPQQANVILSRINAKANDIDTLIGILEGGGNIYPYQGDNGTPNDTLDNDREPNEQNNNDSGQNTVDEAEVPLEQASLQEQPSDAVLASEDTTSSDAPLSVVDPVSIVTADTLPQSKVDIPAKRAGRGGGKKKPTGISSKETSKSPAPRSNLRSKKVTVQPSISTVDVSSSEGDVPQPPPFFTVL